MGFGDKLRRLEDPPPSASPVTAGGLGTADARRAETLAALRSQMQELLDRPASRPPPPADPAVTELPFLRVEGCGGALCQRRERLPPSHHVGRIPVEAARDAKNEMLALLALDPSLSDAEVAGALFIDTETTGLGGGAGTVAFLVGLASFDDEGRLEIEQLLLRTPAEEAPLLGRIAERIASASLLVSYNGKAFDLPLLESRFVMNAMSSPSRPPHLDLLHVARRLHRSRIGRCSLKMVEAEVLGFERNGDIDGADVAPRYVHFLRTGDESALESVVEHNYWDVVSMAALVGFYGEPLEVMHARDLVGLANTFRRARALDRAEEAATLALERGAGAEARGLRGKIAKARGDRARALADFEALCGEVDDDAVRLELAKLYEHYIKAPDKALEMLELGTGEVESAVEKRRARLERKLRTAGRPDGSG